MALRCHRIAQKLTKHGHAGVRIGFNRFVFRALLPEWRRRGSCLVFQTRQVQGDRDTPDIEGRLI